MTVCCVGMGFIGQSLAGAFAAAGYYVIGLDRIPERTTSEGSMADADAVIVCVGGSPRDGDAAAEAREALLEVARSARSGQLIVVETTIPIGTTRRYLVEPLEERGLRAGTDVFVAYSPDRLDRARPETIRDIPKVVGGATPACLERALALYRTIVPDLRPCASLEIAEASKLVENAYRAVNVAFVNDVAGLCEANGLPVADVIDAAATKPFGFQRFEPGPGFGGECLTLACDYLRRAAPDSSTVVAAALAANQARLATPFAQAMRALEAAGVEPDRARVLIVGLTYKAGVADGRGAPAAFLLPLFARSAAAVRVHDPLLPALTDDAGVSWASEPLTPELLAWSDVTVILADHRQIAWAEVFRRSRHVVDTRNAGRLISPA